MKKKKKSNNVGHASGWQNFDLVHGYFHSVYVVAVLIRHQRVLVHIVVLEWNACTWIKYIYINADAMLTLGYICAKHRKLSATFKSLLHPVEAAQVLLHISILH